MANFAMRKEQYTPLSQQDNDECHSKPSLPGDHKTHSCNKKQTPAWAFAIIFFLLISNGLQVVHYYRNSPSAEDTPREYGKPPEIPTQYKQFWWNTEYSSANLTLQDEVWDSIMWTHGMIAMDVGSAKSQNWPETITMPGDETKGVYLLEAYHEVHCLKILRKIMGESLSGSNFTNPPSTHAHVAHCFDYLLQVTMCNADATPLYTLGQTYVGYGQQHKCRDWEALRSYASENTACYMENDSASLEEQFGHCDHGDGLIYGAPQDNGTE